MEEELFDPGIDYELSADAPVAGEAVPKRKGIRRILAIMREAVAEETRNYLEQPDGILPPAGQRPPIRTRNPREIR